MTLSGGGIPEYVKRENRTQLKIHNRRKYIPNVDFYFNE